MRYPASEKLEIIHLVEQSHLPVRRTLAKLGIQPAQFYRWYDRFQTGGPEALEDKSPRPKRVWNRIPDAIRERIIQLALDEPELSPRELATRFTDTANYFVSEASVYRLLKAHDLITSPAYIVMKAADEFKDKTTAPNQLWQTDFTYLKVTGWGWFYLSTVLDDFSRYIIAWKLCTTMKARDVTDTLDLALAASGCDQARIVHKPRLLSDNGSSYVSSDLAEWLEAQNMGHVRGAPYHPQTQGKIERWHQTLKNRILLENYYLPGDLEASIGRFVDHYNHRRYHESLENLTPAMEEKMVGQGSQYAWTARDAKGNPLDGGKKYKLHLPPNIPVKNFWSVILYSDQTRSMIQTDQRFPSVSSQNKGLQVNADGSVDVYFGPHAPDGKASNWVQTIPGKGWNTLFRLYSPLEPWFDKTWRPGEIELQS